MGNRQVWKAQEKKVGLSSNRRRGQQRAVWFGTGDILFYSLEMCVVGVGSMYLTGSIPLLGVWRDHAPLMRWQLRREYRGLAVIGRRWGGDLLAEWCGGVDARRWALGAHNGAIWAGQAMNGWFTDKTLPATWGRPARGRLPTVNFLCVIMPAVCPPGDGAGAQGGGPCVPPTLCIPVVTKVTPQSPPTARHASGLSARLPATPGTTNWSPTKINQTPSPPVFHLQEKPQIVWIIRRRICITIFWGDRISADLHLSSCAYGSAAFCWLKLGKLGIN